MRGKRLNFKGLVMGLLVLIMFFALSSLVFAVEGNLTIKDREIIERLARIEKGQQGLNKRIDDLRSELKGDMNSLRSELGGRIDDLRSLVLSGFVVLFAGMFALVGFVIWDRRSALAPAIKKNKELEEKEDRIERALKEFALKEPKLADVLKGLGML
ncbi:MAG: hypothetical protein JRJ08_01915 [Deltaproteobacteria bacterium]|nr:hypothetical protein [Deltaproteobacteria bacterium]